jgi:hypothetical protein
MLIGHAYYNYVVAKLRAIADEVDRRERSTEVLKM